MQQIVPAVTAIENRIHSFFQNQNLGHILWQSNIRKEKGICLSTLFQFMLGLAFTGKNLCRLLESIEAPEGIGVSADKNAAIFDHVEATGFWLWTHQCAGYPA
jgi:hypothetical protein